MSAILTGIIRGNYRDANWGEMPEEAREVELVSVVDDLPRCQPEPISDQQWAELCDYYAIGVRERPAPTWLSAA